METRAKLELVANRLMELRPEIERMTPKGEDGSQVFGEVTIAVLQQVERIDVKCSDRLIRRIARNKRIDMIRRSPFRRHESLESVSTSVPASTDSLVDLISHLPDADQELLRARFRDGKSWVEIAAEAECEQATIRCRWHRLKHRLAKDHVFRKAANNWD